MTPDDLDRELAAALAAQPSPEQMARLTAFWDQRSRVERRRRQLAQTVALAATVLAVTVASLWLSRPRIDHPVVAQGEAPQPPPSLRDNPLPPPAANHLAHELSDPRSLGRAPTAYEQAVFATLTRTAGPAAARSLPAELDALIDQLAADPQLNARELVESARLAERDAEGQLLRRLTRAHDARRRAIVQLLAACGTARSTPALIQMARRHDLRPDALAAIEQIVGLDALAQVVPLSADYQVRADLYARLLTSGSTGALRGFLRLTSDRALRGEALAAAAACDQLPVDALLTALTHDDKPIRLAAALVLGHVDGPQIAQSLIGIVSGRERPPVEAWVALMACRDGAADRFLAQAAAEPHLLGQVNNARAYWARFVP